MSPKSQILGVGINTTSYEEVCRMCREWVNQKRRSWLAGRARYVCVTPVYGVMASVGDPAVREVLNGADIATPDGMPLVWALRSLGATGQQRVYGPDLMLALCSQAERLGHRVFLYGGRPERLEDLRRRLRARYPGLPIVGTYAPPFRPLTEEEDAAVVREILDSGADLLFLGISTPKQDQWMAEHRTKLPGVVMLGVGAAFDFHSGRVRQAPPWMRQAGLEWLFRLLMEPRRLWKRYLLVTPWFLPLWVLQKAGILKLGPADKRK